MLIILNCLFIFLFNTIQCAHLRVKGEKDDIRQAYLPSMITFVMDEPSFGLDGEMKWVDFTNANERIVDYAKAKTQQDYWNYMFNGMQSLEDTSNLKAFLTTLGAKNAKENYKVQMEKVRALQEKQRQDDAAEE